MNEYEINNLTPYTIYAISVAAGNFIGFGEDTITSFLTTEEGECMLKHECYKHRMCNSQHCAANVLKFGHLFTSVY